MRHRGLIIRILQSSFGSTYPHSLIPYVRVKSHQSGNHGSGKPTLFVFGIRSFERVRGHAIDVTMIVPRSVRDSSMALCFKILTLIGCGCARTCSMHEATSACVFLWGNCPAVLFAAGSLGFTLQLVYPQVWIGAGQRCSCDRRVLFSELDRLKQFHSVFFSLKALEFYLANRLLS